MVIACTSSASSSGAKAGERLSVIGKPSMTYCTWYSEPRGWRMPFAHDDAQFSARVLTELDSEDESRGYERPHAIDAVHRERRDQPRRA
jgi:hypothetical protein